MDKDELFMVHYLRGEAFEGLDDLKSALREYKICEEIEFLEN